MVILTNDNNGKRENSMDDSFVSVDFNSSLDIETEFIFCNVEFNLINMNTKERVKIGYASLYFINVFAKNSWFEIFDAADGISGDMSDIISGLEDVIEQEPEFYGLLVIIDHVQIKKTHRGKGYGTKVLTDIIRHLEILDVDYLALIPSAFEEKDEEKKEVDTQRLIQFYNKFHFNVVKKQGEKAPIMGRNLSFCY